VILEKLSKAMGPALAGEQVEGGTGEEEKEKEGEEEDEAPENVHEAASSGLPAFSAYWRLWRGCHLPLF
jgi:hypothetical protein